MPYDVQTPVFEGPFDLLLHLILREQVDLYEVSLSTIVDGYLQHLTAMEDLDLEVVHARRQAQAHQVHLRRQGEPAARVRALGHRPEDVGRPLGQLTARLLGPTAGQVLGHAAQDGLEEDGGFLGVERDARMAGEVLDPCAGSVPRPGCRSPGRRR